MTPTLYHAPMTCSMAVRIAAAEGDLDLHIERVDLGTKALASGGSLRDVNTLGQVSTLRLGTGEILTETSACLLWVQAHGPNPAFHVTADDPVYFQMVRWLGFVATELHKQIFRVVFYDEATDAVKDRFRALALDRFALLDDHLATRPFLTGDQFCAADAYLSWFFVLAARAGVQTHDYASLEAYRERVLARPTVTAMIEDDQTYREGQQ